MSWATILRKRIGCGLVAIMLGGLVAGCAANAPGEVYDPLEPMNRQIFAFNSAVDTTLVRPAAFIYREATPRPFKSMLSNFLSHITLPLTIVHDLLQGEQERAEIAASRFFVNTVVGMGGLFDVATPHGLRYHGEDMGQTLAVHGSGEGPYLVLPLLGPSNLRDGIGTLIDRVIDPVSALTYIPNEGGMTLRASRTGATVVVTRERLIEPLDSLKRESLDFYTTMRSAYGQRRQAEISNGNPGPDAFSQSDAFGDAEKANAAE